MTQTLSLEELKDLVEFCAKKNVVRVKLGEFAVEFSQLAIMQSIAPADDAVKDAKRRHRDEMDDMETLLHSAQ